MNYLSRYLKERGMTQSDLARALNVSRQTIAKQVRKSALSVAWAQRIAPPLQISVQELLLGESVGQPKAEQEASDKVACAAAKETGLTIAEAKRQLAITLGIDPSSIKIIVEA